MNKVLATPLCRCSPPPPSAPPPPAGRPAGMFQRFASVLFGDEGEELSRSRRGTEEDEDEDWILVNYLTEACSAQCDGLSGSTAPHPDLVQDEEEGEEDLVMIPSPVSSPRIRYASCTSLNSTADTDLDGGAEEHEEGNDDDDDEAEEESGFLRLDACSLEESWFVTPPPCFTGRGNQPVVLETSPLENLLIEHPSMSVYARHRSPPRLTLDPLPRLLDQGRDFLSATAPMASGGKEKARRTLDGPRHRPEAAMAQRRSSLHSFCLAAAFSARAGLLQQHHRQGSSAQPLSRNALRRLNLLRPPKASTVQLHQPSQRHLNF